MYLSPVVKICKINNFSASERPAHSLLRRANHWAWLILCSENREHNEPNVQQWQNHPLHHPSAFFGHFRDVYSAHSGCRWPHCLHGKTGECNRVFWRVSESPSGRWRVKDVGFSLGYICPSSYSPADFFIKTLSTALGHENNSKMTVKKICDHYTVSDYAKEVDVVVQYEFHMGRAEVFFS